MANFIKGFQINNKAFPLTKVSKDSKEVEIGFEENSLKGIQFKDITAYIKQLASFISDVYYNLEIAFFTSIKANYNADEQKITITNHSFDAVFSESEGKLSFIE